MSLWELGESNGTVSLADLFENVELAPKDSKLDLQQIAYLICRGGWPQATLLHGTIALEEARDYCEAIYTADIHRIDDVRRSTARTRLLLRSYARHQGCAFSYNRLSDDIKANDNQSVSYETISDYVEALRKLFVVEDMSAWNPNLRSRSVIMTSDTRYFIDSSIAAGALAIGPQDLMNDLNTLGLLFETMAVRDLRVYADALYGCVSFS